MIRETGETKRGPLAVLLVLLGLVFASASGPAALDGGEAAPSGLAQTQAAKRILLPRGDQRELAALDEDDAGDSFVLPPPMRIVRTAAATRPAPTGANRTADQPRSRPAAAHRARAPPAA